jgi:hypothetical protein
MPHWTAQVYFVGGGLVSCCVGVAVLTNFRGLGKQWDDGFNRNSAYVNKLLNLPWPQNPSAGPTFRPVVGIFMTVVGLGMVAAVLFGAMR